MLKTREQLLAEEEQKLAPYAMHSKDSQGRVHPEQHDDYRLPFQRDRDRIIHSRAFRRLQAKTQVFVSYYGDHYRDRLTHSIEVAQIARDIARRLGLNEDLAECIALAHDLGHPPFGHGGEEALDEALKEHELSFEHNEQSRRIIQSLEHIYPTFDGLNLSVEVVDGIIKHHPEKYKTTIIFISSAPLQPHVADHADYIANTTHAIDDALRSQTISAHQLDQFQLWSEAKAHVLKEYGSENVTNDPESQRRFHSRVISRMISRMIQDLQETTEENLTKNGIDSVEKVRSHKGKIVDFSAELDPHIRELRQFLRKNFYYHPKVHQQIENGQKIVKKLFQHYLAEPQNLPLAYQNAISLGEQPEIVVKDYIAGMTDHYAEEQFQKLLHKHSEA